MSPLDDDRLRTALLLAHDAIGVSEPNPRVGCIIGSADGAVLGVGFTQEWGGPHAEVMALRQAAAHGHDVRGSTAWVTLEPCAHHGRTPPCCDALVAAGVARVVIAVQDPFPAVRGRGMQRLRAAGVEVVVAGGAIADAARELNIGFFSRHQRGRPWVRLKSAASLDGRTALPNGRSQWITGTAARSDGHAWRKRAGAVLTGIGTVLADDPRLDVRLVPTTVQPLRVVLDASLRIPPNAKLLAPPGRVWIVTAQDPGSPREQTLRDAGAEVTTLPSIDGHIDLIGLLEALAQRQINELHVEAGALLSGSLLQHGLVDELLLYVAPILIGQGGGIADGPVLENLRQASRFCFVDTVQVGTDLRLRARPAIAPFQGDPGVEELSTDT